MCLISTREGDVTSASLSFQVLIRCLTGMDAWRQPWTPPVAKELVRSRMEPYSMCQAMMKTHIIPFVVGH